MPLQNLLRVLTTAANNPALVASEKKSEPIDRTVLAAQPAANAEPPKDFSEIVIRSAEKLGGSYSLSAILQPFITAAINLGASKVKDEVSYRTAAQKFYTTPMGNLLTQGMNTLKRRTYTSLIPSTLINIVAETNGLPAPAVVFFNTASETFFASVVTREAGERFNSLNAKQFPILNQNKIGLDLTTISSSKIFFNNIANNPETQKFDQAKYEEFEKKRYNYNTNLPHQAAMLILRNGLFSSAAFMAKPWAKELMEKHGKEISSQTGINEDKLQAMLTYSIRASLAWATTCFDRAFTMMSCGDFMAEEVYKKIIGEISRGNFGSLFTGAIARTALCLMTATTIAEGPEFGKMIKEQIDAAFKDFFVNRIEEKSAEAQESQLPSHPDLGEVSPEQTESFATAMESFAKNLIKFQDELSFDSETPELSSAQLLEALMSSEFLQAFIQYSELQNNHSIQGEMDMVTTTGKLSETSAQKLSTSAQKEATTPPSRP